MKKFSVIKLISLLLIAVFTLGMAASCNSGGKNEPYVVPERVNSDSTIYTSGLYEYYLYEDNTAVIYAYKGEELDVKVPNELDGHTVVEIAPAAFQYNRVIQTVTLGDDLEVIGEGAFYSCRSLKSIKISSSDSPKRPMGVALMILPVRAVGVPSAFHSSFAFWAVEKKPGAMALTRMPVLAKWTASHWVKLEMPDLAAE